MLVQTISDYSLLNDALDYIKKYFSLYSRTADYILSQYKEEDAAFSEEFLNLIKTKCGGKNRFYEALDDFIFMSRELLLMQARLVATGRYENSSFDKANEECYQNREYIEKYFNGLLVSQVFWPNHYKIMKFFVDAKKHCGPLKRVIDVPCGDGIFSYLLNRYFDFEELDCVDISPFGIDYTRQLLNAAELPLEKENFFIKDIFQYQPKDKYDFVVCGELLEHIERPDALLDVLCGLMKDDGRLFLTTAIFSAAVDHIYLFNNVSEVHQLLSRNFSIIDELILPLSLKEYDSKMEKEAINYACVLQKKT